MDNLSARALYKFRAAAVARAQEMQGNPAVEGVWGKDPKDLKDQRDGTHMIDYENENENNVKHQRGRGMLGSFRSLKSLASFSPTAVCSPGSGGRWGVRGGCRRCRSHTCRCRKGTHCRRS
jgi:hypothetical protein